MPPAMHRQAGTPCCRSQFTTFKLRTLWWQKTINLVSPAVAFSCSIGVVIGLAGALALTRILKSVLVQVSPADPASLVTATLVLSAAAVLGCLIPARRAMRVDPIVALYRE